MESVMVVLKKITCTEWETAEQISYQKLNEANFIFSNVVKNIIKSKDVFKEIDKIPETKTYNNIETIKEIIKQIISSPFSIEDVHDKNYIKFVKQIENLTVKTDVTLQYVTYIPVTFLNDDTYFKAAIAIKLKKITCILDWIPNLLSVKKLPFKFEELNSYRNNVLCFLKSLKGYTYEIKNFNEDAFKKIDVIQQDNANKRILIYFIPNNTSYKIWNNAKPENHGFLRLNEAGIKTTEVKPNVFILGLTYTEAYHNKKFSAFNRDLFDSIMKNADKDNFHTEINKIFKNTSSYQVLKTKPNYVVSNRFLDKQNSLLKKIDRISDDGKATDEETTETILIVVTSSQKLPSKPA